MPINIKYVFGKTLNSSVFASYDCLTYHRCIRQGFIKTLLNGLFVFHITGLLVNHRASLRLYWMSFLFLHYRVSCQSIFSIFMIENQTLMSLLHNNCSKFHSRIRQGFIYHSIICLSSTLCQSIWSILLIGYQTLNNLLHMISFCTQMTRQQ